MELLLFGTDHKRSSPEQRELLAFVEEEIPGALKEIVSNPNVNEVCIVNTCNRVEFYASVEDDACLPRAIREYYQNARGTDIRELTHQFYYLKNEQAANHLFRVICSLDSMVLGEVDVIHQVKQMYQMAADAGTSGLMIDRAFHQAFSVAKKARAETSISQGSTSVAMVAVEHAQRVLKGLEEVSAAVIGAGKMATRMARYLAKRGVGSLTLVNRTVEKVRNEAQSLGADIAGLDELGQVLADRELIMLAIDYNHEHLLTADDLSQLMIDRGGRPLTLIDISVPRVVEATPDLPDTVRVYDLDDFEEILQENQRSREAAVTDVEAIIDDYVSRFGQWRQEAVILPDVIRLRRRVKEMCREEIDRHQDEIPAEALPAVREIAKAISERIIKTPIQSLKAQVYETEPHTPLTDFRRLFDLEIVDSADQCGDVCATARERRTPTDGASCDLCAPYGSCAKLHASTEFAS